jgi:hypothetical protein
MVFSKIFLILIACSTSFASPVELDCDIVTNPGYQDYFEEYRYYIDFSSTFCGFRIDKNLHNSSDINFDVEVDGNSTKIVFIYLTTALPILPQKMFEKFHDKEISCVFYNLPSTDIQPNWFKSSENLKSLAFLNNYIPKLGGENFVNLNSLLLLMLQHNSIRVVDETAFNGLKKMGSLDLSHNQIERF